MEEFRVVDAGSISQKENNPYFAEDGEIVNSNIKMSIQQVGVVPKSQQPLKTRNMATQPQNQTELLEKFRKLRQWQQQQQESMYRQQQLAMETLKVEKSKLQTILAAQKKLQEQQHVLNPTNYSPNLESASSLRDVMIMPSQQEHFSRMPTSAVMRPEAEYHSSEIAGPNNTPAPVSFPTSSSVPVSGSVVTQVESSSSSSESPKNLYHLQQQVAFPGIQMPAKGKENLEESVASFNATVYPMMWNSPNYHLPWGSIPISSGVQVTPMHGQPVVGFTSPGSPMSHIGMITSKMTTAAQGSQSQNSTPEHEGFRMYISQETGIQSDLEMNVKGHNDALQRNTTPIAVTQGNERQWNLDPGAQHLLASVESHADDQSDVDAMSGVYPLYDSESEVGLNDVGQGGTEDVDTASDAEEDFEESYEREKTVIDLTVASLESNVANENQQGSEKPEENDEMRPIKPGIGSGSAVKTFEELLEKQLKLEEASKEEKTSQENAKQKPQRTFLRKGQGLARFKGKSTSNKPVGLQKQSTNQSSTAPQKKEKKTTRNMESGLPQGSIKPVGVSVSQSQITRKVASKSAQGLAKNEDATVGKNPKSEDGTKGKTVLAAPTDKPKPIATSSVFTRAEGNNPAGVLNSIDASFQMRLQELEEKQELEEEELEEFELLEQAAANASFSSNSSVVVKVLAKARGSKQLRGTEGILSPVDTGYGSGDGKVTSSADQCRLKNMVQQQDNVSEDEDRDITLQEISLDSALELDRNGEIPKETTGDQHAKAPLYNDPGSASIVIEDDFNDEEAWGEIKRQAGSNAEHLKNANRDDYDNDDDDDDDDEDSDVTISDIFPLVTSTPPAHSKGGRAQITTEQAAMSGADGIIASTPPTSALVTKLFPQLKPKQKATVDAKQPVTEVAPQTKLAEEKKEEASDAVQSIAVRQKLKELESEIDKFRTENAVLAKMRTEREEGLKKLQTEIAAFDKQKTEELDRLEQFREEELRKLRRERRVFEKYQKAARTMPDKKEREEIEALRTQVAELQEELKRRESRWSAASTRSRQRIEVLEQQNKELQDEVKLLEHYRLQQWREDEQAKAREEADSRPKRPIQRKLVKTTEEESGPRLPLSHRSPPLKPALVEAVSRSTPDNATAASENRSPAAGIDSNNNRAMGLPRDEITSSQTHFRSREESPDTPTFDTPDSNHVHDFQQSKRISPRRRSKTPDSEKVKRNVHFQDEQTARQNEEEDDANSCERTGRQDQREIMHSDGKVEKVNSNGSRLISFANGTRKEISADGQTIIVTFFNGDIKQIMPDQRVIYYYSEAQTTHTTYPDGLEVLQFPSKQVEKHYRDGTKEIIFPDQTIKYLYPNGAEECVFSDGTIQKVNVEGERTIEFPNGQRETHTKCYKKREYPDGTVKTVYPDGRTETRYATGRVRVKDRDGRVIVDSSNQLR